jgi:DHA2 family multidrug resistance protein-like MFS transporter
VYRSEVASSIPVDVGPEAAEAAKDTLGGAVGAGGAVPPALLEAARDAFVDGLQLAALTGAVLMALTAAVAAFALRRRRPTGSGSDAVRQVAGSAPCASASSACGSSSAS